MTTPTHRKEAAARLRAAAEWLERHDRAQAIGLDADEAARTLAFEAIARITPQRAA